MTPSCTTYDTFVSIKSSSACIHESAAGSTLIASRPIERTALRTKSMSTSEAYLGDSSQLSGWQGAKKNLVLLKLCKDLISVLFAR